MPAGMIMRGCKPEPEVAMKGTDHCGEVRMIDDRKER